MKIHDLRRERDRLNGLVHSSIDLQDIRKARQARDRVAREIHEMESSGFFDYA